MGERFRGEQDPTSEGKEHLVEQTRKEWQDLLGEEDRIKQEIDRAFENTGTADPVEAQKIVLEQWGSKMTEARQRSDAAFKLFIRTMQENNEAMGYVPKGYYAAKRKAIEEGKKDQYE